MLSPAQRLAAFAFLVLILFGLTTGIYLVLNPEVKEPLREPAAHGTSPGETQVSPPKLLPGPPPDLVLLLSGEMHGYLQPCGCARPQLGGMERRYELLKELHAKGWPVSAIDLGDLAPHQATDQGRMKFETALQALRLMDYAGVGIGHAELTLPLEQALGVAINYQPPALLAANLNDKEERFPEMFKRWTIDQPKVAGKESGFKIGYVGVVGEKVAAQVAKKDASLQFDPAGPAIAAALKEIEPQKPDLLVLLYQGPLAEAKKVAADQPAFRLVLTLDVSDEPSAFPEKVGDTRFISLGHKGKYVGLLGVYRKGSGLNFEYQLQELGPYFELPRDKTNPVREAMRDYVVRVHSSNLLERWPKGSHPVQVEQPEAKYVGATACKDCHKSAWAVCSNSPHAHAYESLVKKGEPVATRERKGQPTLLVGRQSDPECVRCHTTGFDYKSGFVDEKKTPHLLGNQCENCHGPASLHVADPKNPNFSKPLHLTIGSEKVEYQVCRRCHDGDNDPNFKLELYWPKIRHGKD